MTAEKIARKLQKKQNSSDKNKTVRTRLNQYHYVVSWGHPWSDDYPDDIYIYPLYDACEKNLASSRITFASYAYTHGGKTFQDAVVLANEIEEILYPIRQR